MGLFVGDKAAFAASKPKARSKRGSAFDKQFAAARKAGLKTFAFGGKAYNTNLAPAGGTKTAAASPLSGPAFGIGSPPGMPKPRPDTAVVKTATASVPTPAPAGVGDIYRAQENVRRNPPRADPALVAKFTNPTIPRVKPIEEPREVVRGVEVNRSTAKTDRLPRTDLARHGPRLTKTTVATKEPVPERFGRGTKVATREVTTTRVKRKAGDSPHDYSALSFFKLDGE
jgi:hypothetical protein